MDRKNLESSIMKNWIKTVLCGVGSLPFVSMGGVLTYYFVDVIRNKPELIDFSGFSSNEAGFMDLMIANAVALGIGYKLSECAWNSYKKIRELKKEKNYRA